MTQKRRRNLFYLILIIAISTPLLLFATLRLSNGRPEEKTIVLKAVLGKQSMAVPLYGFNGNNTMGPSWSDKTFRDSAASLDFKIIRYPGGGVGEFWDWKKGWFVNDDVQNGIAVPENLKKIKFSPTGLNELKLLVDETHCDVVFTLNMFSKDLSDQMEMLKNAQSIGIPVKWIELGNEYNFLKSVGRQKYKSANGYGQACREWITSLKTTFPGVKVAVIGGNKRFASDAVDWNDNVLNESRDADALVAHIYAHAPDVVDENGINFKDLFSKFKDAFDSQGFDKTNKEIWITEFNINWASGENNDEKTVRKTFSDSWGQTLATILMTSMCTDLPRKTPGMILDHNIANGFSFAAIEIKPPIRVLPNGIGFKLWCDESNNKTLLRQINFSATGSDDPKEFEVLGWEFKGEKSSDYMLVNFTSNPVDVNVSALNNSPGGYYDLRYCDKNKMITSWTDITRERKKVLNNVVSLPPYAIAIMK